MDSDSTTSGDSMHGNYQVKTLDKVTLPMETVDHAIWRHSSFTVCQGVMMDGHVRGFRYYRWWPKEVYDVAGIDN